MGGGESGRGRGRGGWKVGVGIGEKVCGCVGGAAKVDVFRIEVQKVNEEERGKGTH